MKELIAELRGVCNCNIDSTPCGAEDECRLMIRAADALECAEALEKAATNAAATIGAIYQWLERAEAAGGATSIEGVSVCHAMLKSLRKNAARIDSDIIAPLTAYRESSHED